MSTVPASCISSTMLRRLWVRIPVGLVMMPTLCPRRVSHPVAWARSAPGTTFRLGKVAPEGVPEGVPDATPAGAVAAWAAPRPSGSAAAPRPAAVRSWRRLTEVMGSPFDLAELHGGHHREV